MKLRSVTFATLDEAVRAYETDRCNAFTTDASGLYSVRLKLAKPDDHVVLPEIISKEPLGPFVRHGDDQWFDVVKWMLFAMLNAEELNVTKANVDEQMKSDNPEIKRLLGTEDNFGERLGLTKDWAYRIVKQVGNYGEVFDRNVGQGSPLQDRARPQRAVDQGGRSVRTADSLTAGPRGGAGRWRDRRGLRRSRSSAIRSCGRSSIRSCCASCSPRSPMRRSVTPRRTSNAPRSRPASGSGTPSPASTSARR